MSSKNCLNCGNELNDKFCGECGQRSDTHRITVKHFIEHDLLHGVFHLDKGILFTIKEAFTRPGKAAMDYISGKRVSYYNIFYLLLVLLGLNLLLIHYAQALHHSPLMQADKDGVKVYEFFTKNIKFLILSFIPLFAFNGLLLFRRLKLNFAEHHIVSGFTLLGCVMLALLINLLALMPYNILEGPVGWVRVAILIGIVIFPVYVYYLAFGKQYKKLGFIWRISLMYLLFFIEAIITLSTIIIVLSGGHFEGSLHF
jgi:hypothetical protein